MGIKPRPPAGEPNYRFDWDAPVIASRHTPGTVYLGGNRLFISKDYRLDMDAHQRSDALD